MNLQIKSKNVAQFFIVCLFVLCLSACTSPFPLYGTWISCIGDELTLSTDGTFKSKIKIDSVDTELEGTWVPNNRVLQFEADGTRFNSVWNIDAGLLQLSWPRDSNGNTAVIEMYRKEAE